MYGFPSLQLTVVNVSNNTDKTIDELLFNYEGSMAEDVVMHNLKAHSNKQTGISTIHLQDHANIMMYNNVNGETHSYILKPNAINPGKAAKYSGVLYININNIKESGELELSIRIDE
ncbi:hypothetical protein [Clostridium nigeriense]|uniref:hypothetical protein n=1 Tax=Clostridium nigeriense TaxID=1805470 RepID=UPI000837967C|nr:hypothetical protein [Clostridium nigeriense]